MKKNNATEKALLVGLQLQASKLTVEESLDELARLADTAGAEVVSTVIQKRENPSPGYFIGKGKAEEINAFCSENNIDLVIFDDTLSPAQQRNLEEIIQVKIIDRTRLILDIFSQRAHTKEGNLQVELAQLNYLLPRLTGKGVTLAQQVGGIGFRGGPGEKKLEIDKRCIRDRITLLNKDIDKISRYRYIQRKKRKQSAIAVVSLVGYTNAGKSTLLNALSDAGAFVQDKLFATLDPLTRKVILKNNQKVLFTDTVGFIRKLPHLIIAAFRATLEEIKEADILLHVVDGSHPRHEEQIDAVYEVLKELGVQDKPIITVFNKTDLLINNNRINQQMRQFEHSVALSAMQRTGLDTLNELIITLLRNTHVTIKVSIPYNKFNIISSLFKNSVVVKKSYTQKGLDIDAEVDYKTASALMDYVRKK